MKKILTVFMVLITSVVLAQEKEDLQKVKDALVNSVMYTQALEKEVNTLKNTIKVVSDDLKKISTVEQLDSLKVVYGLKPKTIKDESKIKVR